MNETGKDAGNFIGYEYKEVTVPNQQAALYMDAYENFGWKMMNVSRRQETSRLYPFISAETGRS